MKKTAQQLVSEIENLVNELKISLNHGITSVASPVSRKRLNGLTGQFQDLIEEGFFDTPRAISDINSKLRAEGIIQPTTSLMRPLLYLVKNKYLRREKPEKGQYQYKIR